jgi:hypothetical protein
MLFWFPTSWTCAATMRRSVDPAGCLPVEEGEGVGVYGVVNIFDEVGILDRYFGSGLCPFV